MDELFFEGGRPSVPEILKDQVPVDGIENYPTDSKLQEDTRAIELKLQEDLEKLKKERHTIDGKAPLTIKTVGKIALTGMLLAGGIVPLLIGGLPLLGLTAIPFLLALVPAAFAVKDFVNAVKEHQVKNNKIKNRTLGAEKEIIELHQKYKEINTPDVAEKAVQTVSPPVGRGTQTIPRSVSNAAVQTGIESPPSSTRASVSRQSYGSASSTPGTPSFAVGFGPFADPSSTSASESGGASPRSVPAAVVPLQHSEAPTRAVVHVSPQPAPTRAVVHLPPQPAPARAFVHASPQPMPPRAAVQAPAQAAVPVPPQTSTTEPEGREGDRGVPKGSRTALTPTRLRRYPAAGGRPSIKALVGTEERIGFGGSTSTGRGLPVTERIDMQSPMYRLDNAVRFVTGVGYAKVAERRMRVGESSRINGIKITKCDRDGVLSERPEDTLSYDENGVRVDKRNTPIYPKYGTRGVEYAVLGATKSSPDKPTIPAPIQHTEYAPPARQLFRGSSVLSPGR